MAFASTIGLRIPSNVPHVSSSPSLIRVLNNAVAVSRSNLLYYSRSCRFMTLSHFLNARNLTSYKECHCSHGTPGYSGSMDDVHQGGLSEISNKGWEVKATEIGERFSSAFPLWVAMACILALINPNSFLWVNGRVQIIGLTITMLGMGMTLSLKDFQGALAMPREVLAGVVLQYTVMPIAGSVVAGLLGLPTYYAAGLILVACCPGGTASNIVTYIARGNVALSVLMTTCSTFLAVVMTPFLTARLAGQYVAVDANALLTSTLQVVLLPVLVGAGMAHSFPRIVEKMSIFSPSVAVISVAAICGGAIAQNAAAIRCSHPQVFLAVAVLHATGFFLGYFIANLMGFEKSTSRTISIEVGMQNSVLGVVLAGQHFSNPLTAVPCAISSICHSIFGSSLAGIWRSGKHGQTGISGNMS